jgi:hypothetical protein
MANLNKNMRSCSHCNSADMQYYGFAANTIHYYYQCNHCYKFTEYHITSQRLLLIAFLTLTLYTAIVASLAIAGFLLLGSMLLFVAAYKYEWFTEIIALDSLPSDRFIIRAYPKKVRYILIVFFYAALLSYIGLIIYNRMRH